MSPDASPTPPVIGFFGKPLAPENGSDEYKEPTPEGGYIFWRRQMVNGEPRWMPIKAVPPDSDIRA